MKTKKILSLSVYADSGALLFLTKITKFGRFYLLNLPLSKGKNGCIVYSAFGMNVCGNSLSCQKERCAALPMNRTLVLFK